MLYHAKASVNLNNDPDICEFSYQVYGTFEQFGQQSLVVAVNGPCQYQGQVAAQCGYWQGCSDSCTFTSPHVFSVCWCGAH